VQVENTVMKDAMEDSWRRPYNMQQIMELQQKLNINIKLLMEHVYTKLVNQPLKVEDTNQSPKIICNNSKLL